MSVLIIQGDAQRIPLADRSVHCCVTSPPYWGLRDYGVGGQLGLEKTPEEYISKMVRVFREVKRVLRDDGTLWLNMGDSYATGTFTPSKPSNGVDVGYWQNADKIGRNRINGREFGLKPKDLVGIPWRLALALQTDGWYLRSDIIEEVELYCPCGCGYALEERIWRYSQDRDIIWKKPNPMPESVTDRPTKAHEYIFLLSKSERYYYDQEAILEPVSENTHMRLSQNLALQVGSHRANGGGKTNGPMKAVGRKAKQDETGNRRYTGFNERWKVKHNASFDASVCLPVTERNKRSVWTVNAQGFAEAHFATFPEELIKPCILAGCPAKCCSRCGAPWRNLVQKTTKPHPNRWSKKNDAKQFDTANNEYASGGTLGVAHITEIIGHEPTCDCENAGAICGTVLDPFMGSGTTALVARNLNCRAVGIELNESYIKIAEKRLSQKVLEFAP